MINVKKNIEMQYDVPFKIIDSASFGNTRIDIIEIDKLEGAVAPNLAMGLYFMEHKNVKARMVRMVLNDSEVEMESGAFFYSSGNIESSTQMGGIGGTVKSIFKGAVTGESVFRPSYKGTGEIYLEPSVKHYIIMELHNESIIVDKSMYYCSTSGVELGAFMQKNISSAVAGGEGIFQIKLSGTGLVVLESLVPEKEIIPYRVTPTSPLKVDGSFTIARTENIAFSVKRSDKTLAKSLVNGEGLLQTFEGDGIVWLAPTQPVYSRLETGLIYQNKGSNNR